tara:strand:- start:287 stop:802 length:516 start_codon:yes stop_codon:yes gene_type:complete
MKKPLMPKATAVWLIDNTTLTFQQIANFVGLHDLEIQAIADDEVSVGMIPRNPIENGELSSEEIKLCEKDPNKNLQMVKTSIPEPKLKTKGARYTPLSKRADKPNGIAWVLKNLPNLPDSKTCKLIGTTKNTIESVRDRTHWNTANIRAQNPIELGFCTKGELEKLTIKYG